MFINGFYLYECEKYFGTFNIIQGIIGILTWMNFKSTSMIFQIDKISAKIAGTWGVIYGLMFLRDKILPWFVLANILCMWYMSFLNFTRYPNTNTFVFPHILFHFGIISGQNLLFYHLNK
tara:strand:+ start:1068 stop:1427 length:360 start_codon:yes stop_codon:yes gene_type:complete